MTEQTVRVLDPATNTVVTIPAGELAPGMVRTRMQGEEGDVFIPASTVQTAGHQHPPFDEGTRDFLRLLSASLADVHPRTVEQWEDGFRRDAHPQREMEIWANIVAAFRHFTEGKVSDLARKKDIFRLIVVCFTNGPEATLATVELQALSRKRAAQIVSELARGGDAGQRA